LTTTKN